MTNAKTKVFIGPLLENCYLVGGDEVLVVAIKTWCEKSLPRGEFFLVGGMSKF